MKLSSVSKNPSLNTITRTKVSDPPSAGAKGSTGAMGKIIITFHEGLNIRNNDDAALKLAGDLIPPLNKKKVISTPASVMCCQATY